ncbi:MAG: ester cyclase [Gaiellaceae bacterium]
MTDDNKQLIRKLYDEVLNARQLDDLERYIADPQLIETINRGCLVLYESFPDLHSSIDEMVAEGDKVSVRATSTGTHDGDFMGTPPTGRHISFEYSEIYGISDGMIQTYWCLPDMAGLMRQVTQETPVGSSA